MLRHAGFSVGASRSAFSAPGPRLRRVVSSLFLLIIFLLFSPLFAEEDGSLRILAPDQAAGLRPGETVTVRWSGLPDEVEEFELLLLPDEGSDAFIRLSEEMNPRRRSWQWKVPNLPGTSARLEIRFSRGFGEEHGLRSEAFSILFSPAAVLSGLARKDGEWWPSPAWASSVPEPLGRERWNIPGGVSWPVEPPASPTETDPALPERAAGVGGRKIELSRLSARDVPCVAVGGSVPIPQRE